MPKLKLKAKKDPSCDKSEKEKTQKSEATAKQNQAKLFKFFNSNSQSGDENKSCTETRSQVTSKYFDKNKDGTSNSNSENDDSFKDFHEKATKTSSLQTKKESKKPKRKTKIKNATSDLRKYTTEFEKVCSAGGVDVNPEHLQLAIALSLSLDKQNDIDGDSHGNASQSSTSQDYPNENVKRIRKTLSEYGFKMPSGAACTNVLTKRKKPIKMEKTLLLTRTIEERKQILSNAVSRIMFEEQLSNKSETSHFEAEPFSSSLDEICCRRRNVFSKNALSFNDMFEEFEMFYVKNLITPTDSKVGCLLKDWSKIPGRDPSPEKTKQCVDFRESELFAEDFDALLSSCKSYINSRIDNIKNNSSSPVKNINDSFRTNAASENDSKKSCVEIVNVDSRSCSPDLFDEDSYYNDAEMIEPPLAIDDSSNESLPDVFVSQMSLPIKFPQTLDGEVICVEEFGIRPRNRSTIDQNDCSIDLTQKEFDSDDGNACRQKPTRIDEYVSYRRKHKVIDETVCESDDENLGQKPVIVNEVMLFDDIHCKSDDDDRDQKPSTFEDAQESVVSDEYTSNRQKTCINNDIFNESDSFRQKSFIFDETVQEFDVSDDENVRQKPLPNNETLQRSAVSGEFVPSSSGDYINDKSHKKDDAEEISFGEDVVIRRKLASLGSIEDTVRFERVLNEHMERRQVYEKTSDTNESIDLTTTIDEGDFSNRSQSQRLSQIYQNDNGVVHFESYHEMDAASDGSSVEVGTVKNLHNTSDNSNDNRKQNEILNMSLDESIFTEKHKRKSLSYSTKNIHNLSDSFLSDVSVLKNEEIHEPDKDEDCMNNKLIDFQGNECMEREIDFIQLSNENYVEKVNSKHSFDDSNDVFVISDEEFNYSIKNSSRNYDQCENKIKFNSVLDSDDETKRKSNQNYNCRVPNDFDLYGSSIFEQIPSYRMSRVSSLSKSEHRKSVESELDELPDVVIPGCSKNIINNGLPVDKITAQKWDDNILINSPPKFDSIDIPLATGSPLVVDSVKSLSTPKNDDYVIKVDNVTPALNYGKMNTPQVHKELAKYGLKPLKRKRAVQLLEHIYNQTHPLVDSTDIKIKRRKLSKSFEISTSASPVKDKYNTRDGDESIEKENVCDENEVGDVMENLSQGFTAVPSAAEGNGSEDIYKIDESKVALRQVDCDFEDLYFQTKEKSKVSGCRVPLHVAFYNYISLRSGLQHAILTYHPINIDMVHRGLVTDGYRYKPNDLFQFLDKKCITIKTTTKNSGSRQKRR